jgi:hypothetical protein
MAAFKAIRFTSRNIGQLALAGVLLLVLLTVALTVVRNRVESEIIQHAALDLPLLKNRWPQFKQAVRELYPSITESLAERGNLVIEPGLLDMLQQITRSHTDALVASESYGNNGRVIANVEIVYFDRNSVRPLFWHWSPIVDSSLKATEVHTRLSWQQLTETEIITAQGPVTGSITPTSLTEERRAMVLFYLYTEWRYGQPLIAALIRSSQAVALLTVLLIAAWVFTITGKLRFSLLVCFMAIAGLAIYGSIVLKALSLHTVLAMLITLQFGPAANKSVDFAGLSALIGTGYGLLLLGLVRLPARPACPECNRTVSDEFRFCPYCNHVLKHKCSRCAAPVDTRWNYCPSCSEDI